MEADDHPLDAQRVDQARKPLERPEHRDALEAFTALARLSADEAE